MTSAVDGSGYAGQAGSNSAGSDFNVLEFIVSQMIAKIGTMKLVKVTAVKSEGELAVAGLIDVQILVNQIDGLGNATKHGVVNDVPYFRMQGGKNALIMDPVVGDIGLMFCADRDISGVVAAKDQANPGSFRKYDAADGVYIGGILNDVPEQYVQFSSTGIKMADKNGNTYEQKAGGHFFGGGVLNATGLNLSGPILGANGVPYAQNITTTATITGGSVKSGTIDLAAHHHTAQGAFAPTTAAQT